MRQWTHGNAAITGAFSSCCRARSGAGGTRRCGSGAVIEVSGEMLGTKGVPRIDTGCPHDMGG